MVIIKTVTELFKLAHVTKQYKIIADDIKSKLSEMLEEHETFDQLFGGDLKLCETPDDLFKIKVIRKDNGITVDVLSAKINDYDCTVDVADYLLGDASTELGLIQLVTNNAGGDVYVVPKLFWKRINFKKYVKESGG